MLSILFGICVFNTFASLITHLRANKTENNRDINLAFLLNVVTSILWGIWYYNSHKAI